MGGLPASHCGFYRSPLDVHHLFVYVIVKDVIIIGTPGVNKLGTDTADAQGWANKCSGVLKDYPLFWEQPWPQASTACFTGRLENSHTLGEQMTEQGGRGKGSAHHQFSRRKACK